MKIAITGGTGFIGRRLVLRHVAHGDDVRVLSRRKSAGDALSNAARLFQGDLTNPVDLRPFLDGADVLYHCAAEITDPTRMTAVHVDGTRALLSAASGRIGRWVQLSSTGAYGPRRSGVVTEKTDLQPDSVYETTKVKSDALLGAAAQSGGFSHVIVRPSNVYGPDMTNRSLFGLIGIIARGLFFFIGKVGASANYIHVDNVIDAVMLCGRVPEAARRIYNVSDHRTLEHFVGLVCASLGRRDPRARLPEALVRACVAVMPPFSLTKSRIDALTNRVVYSNDKIETELGYRLAVPMETGVRELVEAWKRQRQVAAT